MERPSPSDSRRSSLVDRARRAPSSSRYPPMRINASVAQYTLDISLPFAIKPEMVTITTAKGDKLKIVADAWNLEVDCHFEWEIEFSPNDIDFSTIRAKFDAQARLTITAGRRISIISKFRATDECCLVLLYHRPDSPVRTEQVTMNVLAYSGPEAIQASLDHTLSTLRSILLPYYSVQPISQQALVSQPWQATCALLVFPGCCDIFLSKAAPVIDAFVQGGGAFLALGTGSHYSSRRLDQGILNIASTSISKDMLLRFFDKESGSYIYPSFHPSGSDNIPRPVAIQPTNGERIDIMFQSGTSEVVGVDGTKRNARVLARYIEDDVEGAVSGVLYTVGRGKIILWASSPEYPLTEEPASSISMASSLPPEAIDLAEHRRCTLMKGTLLLLGLQVPEDATTIRRPLPQFLASHFIKPQIVSLITNSIAAPHPGSQLTTLEDTNDKFHFHVLPESGPLLRDARLAATTRTDPSTWQPKHIIVCPEGHLPDNEQTPLFDLTLFFSALSAARKKDGVSEDTEPWAIGDALLYGEAVTSTQTMLDKNPRFMGLLPTPLISLASHQLAGRGRGANVWLSPSGCLQFSLLLRLSLSTFPASKLVFVQYLFALALVEACRDESVLGEAAAPVRLKWPNDVYAVLGNGESLKKKIGGILVNTSFSAGKVDIVIGSGLNVHNLPPIMSLSQLLPPDDDHQLSMERTAAAILVKFEAMWSVFVKGKGSFEPFMDLYLQRDQLVTLTTSAPHQMNGQAPLAVLRSHQGTATVRLLLAKGAEVNALVRDPTSPASLALQSMGVHVHHPAPWNADAQLDRACPGMAFPELDAADVGQVAAAALLEPARFAGAELTLLGPEGLTFDEIAAHLSEAIGKEVTVKYRTAEETAEVRKTMPAVETQIWAPTVPRVEDTKLAEYGFRWTTFKEFLEREKTAIRKTVGIEA
ncbi:biotin-protein ligase [Mycena maculata]|uniref:Biotin-protein ligase n=1 Tax=Mycena maculata TaxID=230809 RepID=A0AAD7JJ71_9AGAR|nr:biotin-protein ligase [Mycena maculata]